MYPGTLFLDSGVDCTVMYPGTLFRDIQCDSSEQRSGLQKSPSGGNRKGEAVKWFREENQIIKR